MQHFILSVLAPLLLFASFVNAQVLADPVSCRVVQERVYVNGRVVVRNIRRCNRRPVVRPRCVDVREQVRIPPFGVLTWRSVRRCY